MHFLVFSNKSWEKLIRMLIKTSTKTTLMLTFYTIKKIE